MALDTAISRKGNPSTETDAGLFGSHGGEILNQLKTKACELKHLSSTTPQSREKPCVVANDSGDQGRDKDRTKSKPPERVTSPVSAGPSREEYAREGRKKAGPPANH